jgi:Flp pilus assembly protein TadG
MVMFTLSLPVLLGVIGLAIDRTILFVVEARLSAAVDGAALGAGRLLGTNANTTEIAGEFLKVDFCGYECSTPTGNTGYWGSYNLTPNITFTNSLGTYTIAINASVTVPLLFMRTVLPQTTSTTVYASATAVRRSTRTVMVLDRSGSMTAGSPPAFPVMQAGAEAFAADFLPGTDEIGLVMLQSSAIVAYPTTYPLVYPPVMTTGGPDTSFDTSSDPPVVPLYTALTNMTGGGGTATAEALSLAYIGLQQAHNRDLAANGVDNMLNSIMLFTDGVPDTIAVSPNAPVVWDIASNSWKGATSVVTAASHCTYANVATNPGWISNPTWASNASLMMMGTMVAPGGPPNPWDTPYGLFLLAGYYPSPSSSGNALTYWEANPATNWGTGDLSQSKPSNALSGCLSAALGAGGGSNLGNFTLNGNVSRVPAFTIYGVSTDPPAGSSPYQGAKLVQPDGSFTTPYAGVTYSSGALTNVNTIPIASWNAVDNLGTTIRSQTAMNQITIYSIGFSGDGGVDAYLLTRLANQGGVVSSTQSLGQYIQVDSLSQLTNAFQLVASYILHLSR